MLLQSSCSSRLRNGRLRRETSDTEFQSMRRNTAELGSSWYYYRDDVALLWLVVAIE